MNLVLGVWPNNSIVRLGLVFYDLVVFVIGEVTLLLHPEFQFHRAYIHGLVWFGSVWFSYVWFGLVLFGNGLVMVKLFFTLNFSILEPVSLLV